MSKCRIPVSWLGPSDRKQYNVRKGGIVTIGGVVGWGGSGPGAVIGRTGKIVARYDSSVMVRVMDTGDKWENTPEGPRWYGDYQVTYIVVPCESPGAEPFGGMRCGHRKKS